MQHFFTLFRSWDGDAIFLCLPTAAARLLRLIPRYHSEVIRSAAETARPRARRVHEHRQHARRPKGLPERCAAAGVLEWAECYLT